MSDYELIDDLYAYNEWANSKILNLCDGLTALQLDTKREIGFGTLRATLFHVLTAEKVWMERWTHVPWREFPTDPDGISLDEIRSGLNEVAAQRRSLIEIHRQSRWSEEVQYADSKKNDYTHRLFSLLLHVANHGVHHRAQALHYLKQCERTVPAGLDYIYYRLAASTLEQDPDAIKGLQDFGLEVATIETADPSYDVAMMDQFYQYHDWATAEILSMSDTVAVAAIDRDYQMGMGSIRKSLLHLLNVEQYWVSHWNGEEIDFPQSPEDTPLSAIRDQWKETSKMRNEFLSSMDELTPSSIVTIRPGGNATQFRLGESALQLVLHGTHHRAQVINMLRRSDGRINNIDLIYSPAV